MRSLLLLATTAAVVAAAVVPPVPVAAQRFAQEVMGPGLYVYQTRVRNATCGDDFKNGYVSSFFASIDGVPGETTLYMALLNSPYWPSWNITVSPSGHVIGKARVVTGKGPHDAREAHFDVTKDGARYTGTGSRTYWSQIQGQWRQCTVYVDVLLRRFDTGA